MRRLATRASLLILFGLASGGTVLGLAAPASAQTEQMEDLAAFPHGTLRIASGRKVHHFDIWIADTPARQEQGLMFVRDLAEGQGMIFPETPARVMNMWMKNTYVELDMVFIGPDGRILKVLEHARPLSLTTLSSDRAVSAVLEIKGSEAGKLGLKVGDRVTWKADARS